MPNRFLVLLTPLVLVIFTQPLVAYGFFPGVVDKILILMVIIGGFRIFQGDERLLAIIIMLFIVAAVTIPLDHFTSSRIPLIVGVAAQIAAMIMVVVYIALEALRDELVTRDTMMGTVAVYLLIGLGFTQIYELTQTLSPAAFSNLVGLTAPQVHAELIYYSLVTLTTLGYGDIVPVLPVARSLAVVEAILGQFFVAAIIGLLINRQSAQLKAPGVTGGSPATPLKES